ncbi:hypothetical protein R69888_02716 [Paraburkholderia haematera]|uniref:Uncharacterized protein n=1 Tax=Paraburkholderia haematera TaxID=2793077 RepID=A0ABM8RCJ6_9BURK|nr:hypothetical protein R69888_02716 [Paraburkholderia haematera]
MSFAFQPHAIGTSPRPGKHVFLALNRTFLTDDLRKQLQLRAAKTLAGACRRADRAVVLEQQPVAPVFVQLGARSAYFSALAVFALGTVVCATAPSMPWMLTGRTCRTCRKEK